MLQGSPLSVPSVVCARIQLGRGFNHKIFGLFGSQSRKLRCGPSCTVGAVLGASTLQSGPLVFAIGNFCTARCGGRLFAYHWGQCRCNGLDNGSGMLARP